MTMCNGKGSVGQEFGQGVVGIAYLWSTIWGALAGRFEDSGLESSEGLAHSHVWKLVQAAGWAQANGENTYILLLLLCELPHNMVAEC